jgi:hypothetical protein
MRKPTEGSSLLHVPAVGGSYQPPAEEREEESMRPGRLKYTVIIGISLLHRV